MGNPSPTPRSPGGGRSKQVSVYLTPEFAAELERLTADMTTQQRSRTLGRWLMLGCTTEQQFEATMKES